jgi:predicted ATPase/DNA-binding winged helix-turn-helix (wHTH) protein/Tfp pilus assembly protein PilF
MIEMYEVGPFLLDPGASLLTLSGVPVALGRRAINVLAALVQSPQQCVTKARLMEVAWPGLVVEEHNLAVQISGLRRVLAQAQGGESWIETLAGRGYRFVGPVRTTRKPEGTEPSSLGRNHNLPSEIDTFVGRTTVIQELWSLLDNPSRIVSIVGTGGVGKTRLAQRFAWTSLSRFAGGVWFCDVSAARTVDGIAHAVARGLDVPLSEADPLAYLTRVICERGECLLILDNFEQVARHAYETLVHWAERAPDARFLVTTRELLGVPGEAVVTLGPLEIADAATLFLQRASAVEAEFSPTTNDRPAILRIAKLLDCLPLAIELAAARARVLSPRLLLQRMDHGFSILPMGRRRAQRHNTLRATFDWSWELLELHERSALAALSVFEGGFTVDAAEALLDSAALNGTTSAVDVVQALVEKSLVIRCAAQRFMLLETIKAYASEHLEADPLHGGPVAARSARVRHYRYFANLDETEATAERGVEIDNIIAACRQATKDGDPSSATGALARAWEVLVRTGPYRQALALTKDVESMAGLSDARRAVVEWVAGMALFSLGLGGEAKTRFERGLTASRASGGQRVESLLLRGLSEQLAVEGRIEEALAHAEKALAIAVELGDRSLQCTALNRLGATYWRAGRLAEARESYDKALQLAQEIGDHRMQGVLTGNLGIVHHDSGDLERAGNLYEQALSFALEMGDRHGEAAERGNLAGLHLEQGATEKARIQYESALSIGRFLGHARTECASRVGLGNVFAAIGDNTAAREHYRLAAELAHETDDRRAEGRTLSRLGLTLARLGAYAESQERFVAAEALLRAIGDTTSLVELYCRWAEGAFLNHDPRTGDDRIGRAEDAVLAVGSPCPRPLEDMLGHVRSLSAAQS